MRPLAISRITNYPNLNATGRRVLLHGSLLAGAQRPNGQGSSRPVGKRPALESSKQPFSPGAPALNGNLGTLPHATGRPDGRGSGSNAPRKPRIALYSHDTMGMGHMRRNLLIAQTLCRSPLEASVLMVAGAVEANALQLPDGVDWLTLPALHKESNGDYGPKNLNIGLDELISLRSKAICAAFEAFQPDVLIVDKVPTGALGELRPALDYLRERGSTRCVLGLRDILDEPAAVKEEWYHQANERAILDYYSAVWVYGDPAVYDVVREYNLAPDVACLVRYTGYLDGRSRLQLAGEQEDPRQDDLLEALGLPPGKLALCLVGGGQDGVELAASFAQAAMPASTNGVILTGPYMPDEAAERVQRLAAANPRLWVIDFLPEATLLLQHADQVVAMGGYNTMLEVVSFDKRALVVPRVKPRLEQHIRATRFSELGLLDMLHPDDLSPETLSSWLSQAEPSGAKSGALDLSGLSKLPALVLEMLEASPRSPIRSPITSVDFGGLSRAAI